MQNVGEKNQKKKAKKGENDIYIRLSSDDIMEDVDQICQVIISLLLNATDLALDRVIFKFIENNFDKLKRLVELHNEYF